MAKAYVDVEILVVGFYYRIENIRFESTVDIAAYISKLLGN